MRRSRMRSAISSAVAAPTGPHCAPSSAPRNRREDAAMNIANRESATLSRRAFLASTGALMVTLAAPADFAQAANGAATRPPLTGDQLSSYISIEPDGTVLAYYGKIDGGQGLGTAIAQMVAEEIDVAFERVKVVMG